jgi:uncharacterized protein YcfL
MGVFIMNNRLVINFLFVIVVILIVVSCNQVQEKPAEISATKPSGKLYMDIHKNVDGLTAEAVIGAHKRDVEVQKKYGVNYKKYWYDEESGTVFCLVDAPSKEHAKKVHEEAHGLVADEIIEVSEGI